MYELSGGLMKEKESININKFTLKIATRLLGGIIVMDTHKPKNSYCMG